MLQVSETENIRKNLAIERMIVEGCDILLDVNQMFVRQGTLVQILPPGSKQGTRGTLLYYTGSFCLMRISLLPISLLRFFKAITKIWLMRFYGLFILLLRT